MENFLKIATVTQTVPNIEGVINVTETLDTSIAWRQLVFCHPYPSDFIKDIKIKISEDNSYAEIVAEYYSLEVYKDWFKIYGEIAVELYKESVDELEPKGLVFERFYSDLDNARLLETDLNALPLENFKSKFDKSFT